MKLLETTKDGTLTGKQDVNLKLPDEVKNISDYLMSYWWENSTKVRTVDFNNLSRCDGIYGLEYAFYNSSITSFNAPNLTYIGPSSMKYCFSGCNNITKAEFPKLVTISNSAMDYCFENCNISTVSLPNVETIDNFGMVYCFTGCSNLTQMEFPKLKAVGNESLQRCFNNTGLKTLSFPSLTTTSFMNNVKNTFNGMLGGVTGCTVHFPSNIRDTIQGWNAVKNGFSGTTTTILFDLPATS